MKKPSYAPVIILGIFLAAACRTLITPKITTDPSVREVSGGNFDEDIDQNSTKMVKEGREIFRYESFGSEAFWGDQLKLHQAILGDKQGGVGKGLTPNEALKLGLKVDITKLPRALVNVLRETAISLENPETTTALLRSDAVVGVKGVFKDGKMVSMGISCALCHSTVDNSFANGIGRRLDGWPNRDLDVGAIAAMAPNLTPLAKKTGKTETELKNVLLSWGPGRYDAEFNQDGISARPDGKTAATLLPAAFGLAGVNLHTYSGWGSVTYWNAYVANTQMFGNGRFFDPRMNDTAKFPLAVKNKTWDIHPKGEDLVTPKLAALHYYQLSIPAPKPPEDSYDKKASERGEKVFAGKAQCSVCHVPPLFTEPGWSMHTAEEMGIDDFQAKRSPDERYRTTPLKGLFTRAKGGFYHDGRFPDQKAVVEHYNRVRRLGLTEKEKSDLVEFLKSL